MRKFLPLLSLALAIYIGAVLTGCGGSSGGSDNPVGDSSTTPVNDPFKVDNYTEYKQGTDLSGIWMMIATSDYDVSSDDGIHHASESIRSTVFIKESNSGSYSNLDVSSPFCGITEPYINVSYSGNNVLINTYISTLDMTVTDYSRMSGRLTNGAYGCGSDICISGNNDDVETKVEMVKVAPLPIGNWSNNFRYAAPEVGTVAGVVQSDATTDAFEFGADIDCFTHSKGHGGKLFMATAFQAPVSGPDYESIIVSTKDGDNLFINKSGGVLTYEDVVTNNINYPSYFNFAFSQSTKHFNMSVTGLNPTKINVSADASSDASSDDPHADGAELDIHFNY